MTFYLTNDYQSSVDQEYNQGKPQHVHLRQKPESEVKQEPNAPPPFTEPRQLRYRHKASRPRTGYVHRKVAFTPFIPANKIPGGFIPIQVQAVSINISITFQLNFMLLIIQI